MSFPSTTVYKTLIAAYPTWESLSAYLKSDEGGALRIEDQSLPTSPFAVIRYVKGASDLTKPHVRAFRSVVWDTLAHRPVSVTSWKSADGESTPDTPFAAEAFHVQHFVDGVLIGMFWDSYNSRWRIHTRTTLDAQCRFYSQTRTFASLFDEATHRLDLGFLDKTRSYSWTLQHPENRIVCAVLLPRATITDVAFVDADGVVTWSESPQFSPVSVGAVADWADVREKVAEMNRRFAHNSAGLVIKSADGRRWKLRTPEYNRVRLIRGNSARRDFLWLQLWSENTLRDYLTYYPEERALADGVINSWKRVTSDVYNIYRDVFKARTMPKTAIPPKYKPLIYDLHNLYMNTLKPAGKTVDWKVCLEHMNSKDTAQKLFVINWEVRNAARALAAPVIPLEPVTVVRTVVAGEEAVAAVAVAVSA
jgi:hypothetical protein